MIQCRNKHLPAPFFNHFIQPNHPAIAKLISLHGVLRGQLPAEKRSHHFAACPRFDNFKVHTPHTQPICFSKSCKYENYGKTKYKVSPYCQTPQANLINRLFTAPELTLYHYRGVASITIVCIGVLTPHPPSNPPSFLPSPP